MDMLELAKALAAAAADAEKVLSLAAEKEKTLKALDDSLAGTRQVKEQTEAELRAVNGKVVAAKQELAALEARIKAIKEKLAGL